MQSRAEVIQSRFANCQGYVYEIYEKIIYDKLERRYPKQLSIFKDIEPEESYWKRKKKYYKMLDFCTCTNPECLNYHKPYNGSNLRVIESKSGQSVYIICSVCKKKLSLKKDVFFYGIDKNSTVDADAVEKIISQAQVCPFEADKKVFIIFKINILV